MAARLLSAVVALALVVGATASRGQDAAEPLRHRIDRMITAAHVGAPAPAASDAEFLRRVSLDLIGVTPSAEDAKAFLADTSADKRERLVDQLLASPRHFLHMAEVLDVMLMERRKDQHVKSPEWREYLRQSVEANKPLNQLVREILGADGTDDKLRPAAKFYLDRQGEPNLLTRDVGRVFFGMDLQCAQCHDHPLIDDYYQSDYYGLFAFLNRSFVFADPKAKKSFFAEKAEGDVAFKSVFTGESGKTGPRLPGGQPLPEPTFKKGEEYVVKPAKNVRPIPKHSRRALLAKHATDGSHRAFNVNLANRLWAHLMGRGLVHPVDLHHDANPSAHPELTEMLGRELAAMNFDMRAFLRELALTETYRRGIDLPENVPQQGRDLAASLPTLQKRRDELSSAADVTRKAIAEVSAQLQQVQADAEKTEKELAAAKTAVEAARAESTEANKLLAALEQQMKTSTMAFQAVGLALTSAQTAARLLPTEPVLKEASDRFAARQKTLAVEVAKLKPQLDKQTAAAKAAAMKLQSAEALLKKLTEQLAAANGKLAELTPKSRQLAEQRRADERTSGEAARRVRDAEQLIAYATLRTTFDKLTAEVQPAVVELTTAETSLAALENELKTQRQLAADAQAAMDAAVKQLTATTDLLQRTKTAAELLAAAVAGAAEAQKTLAADAEIKELHSQLAARSAALGEQAAAAEKTIAAAQSQRDAQTKRQTAAEQALAAATKKVGTLRPSIEALRPKVTELRDQLQQQTARHDEALSELTDAWTRQFAVAGLKPLTPEQLAWSMMQATDYVDRQRAAAGAEWLKKNPLPKGQTEEDPARSAARHKAVEQATYTKLQGQANAFVSLFGSGAGQPQAFFATVDQALFFANGGQVAGWINPAGQNLTGRLAALKDPQAFAEELYISVLTRAPSADEVQEVAQHLSGDEKERPARINQLVWALLTSAEFRFNH